MSKFDAKRLTHAQLLDCTQAYLEKYAYLDNGNIVSHLQTLLDSARVPELKTAAELEKELVDYLLSARPSVCASFLCELDLIRNAREREAGEG